MHRIGERACFILAGLFFVLVLGGTGLIHYQVIGQGKGEVTRALPILLDHKGAAPALERPAVEFDHDRHTTALKQHKKTDCKVCHVLEEKDQRIKGAPVVQVFRFPKASFNRNYKEAIMRAYHTACGNCHRERAEAGKKAGPDIGLCGECHVRKARIIKVAWAWKPIFNYARHNRHVTAIDKLTKPAKACPKVFKLPQPAAKPDTSGRPVAKKCETCHHTYDEKQKRLVYKKDFENSCRACHKEKDEKNARSMKMIAHAQCVGCHMELEEAVKKELAKKGRKKLTEQDKKRFGPFQCKGCHGEHKILKPDEIVKIPRLVRGQKDVMDLFLKDPKKYPKATTMKVVPFNHKAHEPRTQFCNSCHHYSLEKCVNCHTPSGDFKKGGGVSFERAFHKIQTKQSCMGCHQTKTQQKECAGCHQWIVAEMPQQSCPICHRGTSEGKPIEVAPVPLVFDKEKVPEKEIIKGVENEFKPAEMPHQKIVKKLTEISNKSSLARFFHPAKSASDQTLCQGCHHHSRAQATKKYPNCRQCHGRPFVAGERGRPGIMAAYHQQCIGCHTVMGQKPKALDCDKCHARRKPGEAIKVQIPLRGFWK
jgi:hypothetical protein